MYEHLYNIAWNVTRGLFVRGYDREDLVQECMLKAHLKLKDYPVFRGEHLIPPDAYVYKMMRNRILDLIKKKAIFAQEYIECFHVPMNTPVIIPVPASDEMARKVVIALLENNMSIHAAADDLNLTFHQTHGHWRRAKNIILSSDRVVDMLRDETILLAANM
jgi:DNA-directed RNA polymerase specialized sigma24 family protein